MDNYEKYKNNIMVVTSLNACAFILTGEDPTIFLGRVLFQVLDDSSYTLTYCPSEEFMDDEEVNTSLLDICEHISKNLHDVVVLIETHRELIASTDRDIIFNI